jgi:predicted transcriptional regulator
MIVLTVKLRSEAARRLDNWQKHAAGFPDQWANIWRYAGLHVPPDEVNVNLDDYTVEEQLCLFA